MKGAGRLMQNVLNIRFAGIDRHIDEMAVQYGTVRLQRKNTVQYSTGRQKPELRMKQGLFGPGVGHEELGKPGGIVDGSATFAHPRARAQH